MKVFNSFHELIWIKRKILNTETFLTDFSKPSSNLAKIWYDSDFDMRQWKRLFENKKI